MKQQEATISWRTAKNDSKKTRKGKKKILENFKKQQKTFSVLSSSDEEDLKRIKEINVVHHVNRGDGEMPENALSSNEEDNKLVNFCWKFLLEIF